MSLMDVVNELKINNIEEDVACVVVANARNKLLSLCDWTQMPDVDLSEDLKNEWKDYRSQLRDITKRADFPFLESEPTPPQTKVWIAERNRTPEEEEAMRLERQELERIAIKMQEDYEKGLIQ